MTSNFGKPLFKEFKILVIFKHTFFVSLGLYGLPAQSLCVIFFAHHLSSSHSLALYGLTDIFTFTFMHLADAFIQRDFTVHIYILISSCFPWESNP